MWPLGKEVESTVPPKPHQHMTDLDHSSSNDWDAQTLTDQVDQSILTAQSQPTITENPSTIAEEQAMEEAQEQLRAAQEMRALLSALCDTLYGRMLPPRSVNKPALASVSKLLTLMAGI